MVFEGGLVKFQTWFAEALPDWSLVVGTSLLGLLLLAYLRLSLSHGAMRAGELLVTWLLEAGGDLVRTSPRRVWALAWLTTRESLRRQLVAGVGAFLVILAFAVWFFDAATFDPTAQYLNFAMSSVTFLSLGSAVLMSVFVLPGELKNKTIYTLVTKPVRSSEIVLGRVLGIAAIGTAQLLLLGLISYLFVIRSLNHSHTIQDADLQRLASITHDGAARQGKSSREQGHTHLVTEYSDGTLGTDEIHGHWHPVAVVTRDGKKHYELGPPQEQLHARVPLYGQQLRFFDRAGNQTTKGTNVGYLWTYRSYVEGGTLAAAVWRFEGVTADRFPNGVPIDLDLKIYRTRKAENDQGVVGSIVCRNPRSGRTSEPINFIAHEFVVDRHLIPRQLLDKEGQTADLFEDLANDGELEVQLSCLEQGTYFGLAQPDVYLLAREGSVVYNYLKALLSIWCQMLLVVSFGVTWSTFLSGAVAMLGTISVLIGGYFRADLLQLASGKTYGGGTFESLLRIGQNKAAMVPLDAGTASQVATSLDTVSDWVLGKVCQLLPDLYATSCNSYVTNGYDIPWDPALQIQLVMSLAFVVPLFLVGYVLFRAREVAA